MAETVPQPVADFETDRLRVVGWPRLLEDRRQRDVIEDRLSTMLTPPVLAHLPEDWHAVAEDNLADWVSARAEEGFVYGVVAEEPETLIGLLILVEMAEAGAIPSIHLGYLFAEEAWGRGYATELVTGVAAAAAAGGRSVRLLGGVGKGNPASAKVLVKSGFTLSDALSNDETDMYVRTLG